MIKLIRYIPGLMAVMFIALMVAPLASATTIQTITKEELKPMLDRADVVVLDARSGRDWKSSEFMITGAQRANPGEFSDWIAKHDKSKTYVLYCA